MLLAVRHRDDDQKSDDDDDDDDRVQQQQDGHTMAAGEEELMVVLRKSEDATFGFSLLRTDSLIGFPHVIYDIVENSPAAECGEVSTYHTNNNNSVVSQFSGQVGSDDGDGWGVVWSKITGGKGWLAVLAGLGWVV